MDNVHDVWGWKQTEVEERDETRRGETVDTQGNPRSFALDLTLTRSLSPRTNCTSDYNRMTHYFVKQSKKTRSTTWAGTLRTRDRTLSSLFSNLSLPLSEVPSLLSAFFRRDGCPLRDIRFTPSTRLSGTHHCHLHPI
jgi:hypothetical protein